MGIGQTFLAYAQAFEQTFVDDDWSRIEPFFTPDAVYSPGSGEEIRGRQGVLDYLKNSLDSIDRRFDSRLVQLTAEPVVTDTQVTIQWSATYEKSGVPTLVVTGSETATFEGNAIARLEDVLDDGVVETLQSWREQYGEQL
jgi:hypothetical protein